MGDERWMVVDAYRTPVIVGMYRRGNAVQEAELLNREGWAGGRPYRVVRDAAAEDVDGAGWPPAKRDRPHLSDNDR